MRSSGVAGTWLAADECHVSHQLWFRLSAMCKNQIKNAQRTIRGCSKSGPNVYSKQSVQNVRTWGASSPWCASFNSCWKRRRQKEGRRRKRDDKESFLIQDYEIILSLRKLEEGGLLFINSSPNFLEFESDPVKFASGICSKYSDLPFWASG